MCVGFFCKIANLAEEVRTPSLQPKPLCFLTVESALLSVGVICYYGRGCADYDGAIKTTACVRIHTERYDERSRTRTGGKTIVTTAVSHGHRGSAQEFTSRVVARARKRLSESADRVRR